LPAQQKTDRRPVCNASTDEFDFCTDILCSRKGESIFFRVSAYNFSIITPCATFSNCLSFLQKQESGRVLYETADSCFRRNDRESCTPRYNFIGLHQNNRLCSCISAELSIS
jgi:hypothetical protein